MTTLFNLMKNSSDLIIIKEEWIDYGYIPISSTTHKRYFNFLLNNIKHASLFDELSIKEPEINLCIDESVDISWRFNEYRLLVNVKESRVEWYGDKGNNVQAIKGKQDNSSRIPLLYEWINNNLKAS
jgi:hypothetical protein